MAKKYVVDDRFVSALSRLVTEDLRSILAENGLKVAGTKVVLVERAKNFFQNTVDKHKDGLIPDSTISNRFSKVKGSDYYAPSPSSSIAIHLKRKAEVPTPQSPPKKLRKISETEHVVSIISYGVSDDLISPSRKATQSYPNPDNVRVDLATDPFFSPVLTEPLLLQVRVTRSYEAEVAMDVSPEKHTELRNCRYRFLVRCFPTPANCFADQPIHHWPPGFNFKINGVWVDIPNTGQKKNKALIPQPIDITPHVKKGLNQFFVMSQSSTNCFVVVQVMEQIAIEDLIDNLKAKNSLSFQKGKKKVVAMFSADAKNEVQTLGSKVCLVDPLVRTRIKIASRSKDCKHVQCFDLYNYLKANERGPTCTWLCPVCYNKAPFESLIVDEYFNRVVEEVPCDEIQLNPDGTWQIPKETRANETINTVDVCDLDDSSDDDDVLMTDHKPAPPKVFPPGPICIDSDDDDQIEILAPPLSN